jgi:predicted AlkP superfamily phosphohydrolase/phosphomutase
MKSDHKPKVAVLGLDGATFDVIDPLLDAGELPNLKSLIDRGIRAPLRSTVPSNSSVAWSTFITGKNAGKHGIFYFLHNEENSYERKLVNSREIRSETLWSILSRHGSRVGAMNVPMTYPPEKIEGFIISGLLSPSEESIFTYPPDLHTELISVIGDYTLDIVESGLFLREDRFEIFKSFYRDLELKEAAACYLLDTRNLDFFMVVFTETDRLAHVAWRFRTPHYTKAHPGEAAKFGELIPQCYRRMDGTIGKILEHLDRDTIVIVLSDHGSGPIDKIYRLNLWLRQEGYLCVRSPGRFPSLLSKRPKTHSVQRIDWKKTKAYGSLTGGEDCLWINLRGREPEGIVTPGEEYESLRTEIMKRLLTIADPDTGEPIIEHIYRREEIYHGRELERAPDIVWVTRNTSYNQSGDLDGETVLERPSTAAPGMHRQEGILIAAGDPIAKGRNPGNAHLQDLAPTILYLMNQPVPDDMDGRILEEMIDPHRMKRIPPGVEKAEHFKTEGQMEYSGSEEENIRERLRGLGYIE